jgi:hypothetical protein
MAGKPKPKSHCNYGHAMTPENTTVIQARGSKYPHRQCRICMDITPADVERIETHIRGGGSFRSLELSFAKEFGLEAYRAKNPEWSKEMLAASRASFSVASSARFAQRTANRTHCGFGHELTPDILDKDVAAASIGWNPRACRLCRPRFNSVGKYLAEPIDTVPRCAAPKKIAPGILRRTHCKFGHALTPDNIVVVLTFKHHKHHQCKTCVNLTDEDAAELMKHLRAGIPLTVC